MIPPRFAYRLWLAAARRHHRAYEAALADPERAQHRLLARILRANRDSAAGRRLGFAAIDSPEAYRRRVPPGGYEELRPHVDAIRAGSRGVLTAAPVERLVPTGGSTGAPKLIPFTHALGRDFARAVGAWLTDLAGRHPGLCDGPAYWSVSPAMEPPAAASAVPVGFDDDAAYLGRALEPLVTRTLAAPAALRHVRPLAAFRYVTLRYLVAARELRLISIWHPSFLDLVLAAGGEHWGRLVEDVARGTLTPPAPLGRGVARALRGRWRPDPERAAELRALGPGAAPAELWPRLAVVSAWGDAAARAPFAALARQVGEERAQPKGLLATEACVSLPFAGRHPFAVTSTVVELLDERGRPRWLHQAEDGAAYEVVVTTAGGLYRYRLGDRVEVRGRAGATPSVRLLGRADAVVDRVGEKISEELAGRAIAEALAGEPGVSFTLLAPEGGQYTLYLDRRPGDPAAVRARLTAALRRNPGFAYAQDLGQLGPLRLVLVPPDAGRRFLAHRHAGGRVLGGVKPTHLADQDDWTERLGGRPLDESERALSS